MKTRYEKVIEKNSVFCWLGFGTILLLLIPALGMLISNEVQWQIMDFIVMGVMIFSLGTIFIFLSRITSSSNRVYVAIFVLFTFLVLWAELAVDMVTRIIT